MVDIVRLLIETGVVILGPVILDNVVQFEQGGGDVEIDNVGRLDVQAEFSPESGWSDGHHSPVDVATPGLHQWFPRWDSSIVVESLKQKFRKIKVKSFLELHII